MSVGLAFTATSEDELQVPSAQGNPRLIKKVASMVSTIVGRLATIIMITNEIKLIVSGLVFQEPLGKLARAVGLSRIETLGSIARGAGGRAHVMQPTERLGVGGNSWQARGGARRQL